jgi:hypothetical protein
MSSTEYRGLITGAGANLENLVAGFNAEFFRHIRNDKRLGNGLAIADRTGMITIGISVTA